MVKKSLYLETKDKYDRLKHKCLNLNKENEFYNEAMDILVQIRKILAKQNKSLVRHIKQANI